MDAARELWSGLDPRLTTAIAVALILAAAVVLQRAIVRALRRAYWRRVERASTGLDAVELARMKRQKTLVTLLESLVRYGVYGAALVIVLGVVTGGKANAFFGASVAAVLVGFGLQRLLGDVVAGALLLFEGHFAVGDVVTVHQHNLTGTVEAFSLRTTSLRTLGGDLVTLMNGSMLSFTRWSSGQREHRIELLVRDADGRDALMELCESEAASATSLWVRPPRLESTDDAHGGSSRLVLTAVVSPEHEVLVERFAAVVSAVLEDDQLVGPVTTVPVDAQSFAAWRSGLLVRE